MFDFIKAIAAIALVWVLWLAIPIAAILVGTVLALWVLYFGTKVAQEEIDYEQPTRSSQGHGRVADKADLPDQDVP